MSNVHNQAVVIDPVIIDNARLRWQDVVAVARHGARLELSAQAWARVDNAQAIVQRIVHSGERAYGINTGLGGLSNVSLQHEQLSALSRNTLLSHACGVGPALSNEQTRAIICAAVIQYSTRLGRGRAGGHPDAQRRQRAGGRAGHRDSGGGDRPHYPGVWPTTA